MPLRAATPCRASSNFPVRWINCRLGPSASQAQLSYALVWPGCSVAGWTIRTICFWRCMCWRSPLHDGFPACTHQRTDDRREIARFALEHCFQRGQHRDGAVYFFRFDLRALPERAGVEQEPDGLLAFVAALLRA